MLSKALSLDKEGRAVKNEESKTVIRETLFKLLNDRCSLADLLSGDGITAQEANKFNEDLTSTLQTVCPPEQHCIANTAS